jgi:hypothetical protein
VFSDNVIIGGVPAKILKETLPLVVKKLNKDFF